MKKLLSLPPNLGGCFHEIKSVSADEFFCTSDPIGKQLGSGGGTAWLLESCRLAEAPETDFPAWLSREKRILLHAGGQSRRLPAYAPSGKILTPLPVFRWVRGQRLSQDLLSLQLPLYEKIMTKAPAGLHTLVASGDVFIRANRPLERIPEADVVCYGLWVDPLLATHHGVFLASRQQPDALDYMLQKPSMEELGRLAATHLFLMDIGLWLLSDRAVALLKERASGKNGQDWRAYDLYAEFGFALGRHPQTEDAALNALSVAILPLPGGEFYHYGTGRELISSTLAVQNLVRDQRLFMQGGVKPHQAMFVQNADVRIRLRPDNSELWIENSCIGPRWKLADHHILTGIPDNDWDLELAAGQCVDVVPMGESGYVARPYAFEDSFAGERQYQALFPFCKDAEDLGKVLRWMLRHEEASGEALWKAAPKYSAADLLAKANLPRLFAQRRAFLRRNLPALAKNHEKSVFYQLDLADTAAEWAAGGLPLLEAFPAGAPLMKQAHDRMFRSRVKRLRGEEAGADEQAAFTLLREGIVASLGGRKECPHLNVFRDQIVWGRSPVRIDLAGGWTDTPPYCLYAGGKVLNLAIELNGQPPLQVYVKPSADFVLTLRSIDLGAMERISSWEELAQYNKVGSPFSIPKASLALAGFLPAFGAGQYASLEEQLRDFGAGIEITLLAAIPAGSGLGTSSILASTVLGALSDFCGLGWDKTDIGNRTLVLEQLLTTGGGWQDPFGGILQGVKLLETGTGFDQSPLVRWLPDTLFADPQYRDCHLLYYTGITRTAKGILAEIVRSMFLNSGSQLRLLEEMKAHTLDMYEALQCGRFEAFGRLLRKTWEQNKALDAGTNPLAIEALIHIVDDLCLGYKLPGAGGGGYLYMVAKDPEAAGRLRRLLTAQTLHPCARLVEMRLSKTGLQTSRS
ncbi:MAG: bifunctional fucokinase/L-fucose-1-P-guanylyltransferase [Tannerella sp.]|jgi:galactokinase/mevalonate kinase-like predicted kinase|nr:bifunctional fucokinase/L-fucose-1-P-guanylyltransferase [Tannerella sp.]